MQTIPLTQVQSPYASNNQKQTKGAKEWLSFWEQLTIYIQ